jgi:hypothetical protein
MDLISDVLPFTPLWYDEPDAIANAVSYAKFCSRSTKMLSTYRRRADHKYCQRKVAAVVSQSDQGNGMT